MNSMGLLKCFRYAYRPETPRLAAFQLGSWAE